MNESIFSLIEKAEGTKRASQVEKFAKSNGLEVGEGDGKVSRKDVLHRMNEGEDYLYALFTGENYKGERCRVPSIPISEMSTSSDMQILMPRVISNVMLEPKEPALFLSNFCVEEIALEEKAPLWITFPAASVLQAYEIGEGQEYRSQNLNIQENMVAIRLQKIGLQVSLSEEIITHSMYPLVTLNLRLINNAINRRGESTMFTAITERALEVYNNDNGDTSYRTTGVDTGGAWNGSAQLKDILRLAAVVVGNRYEPSHLLIHPLAYFVIFQDPIIRSTFFHMGQIGGSIWNQNPNFDQNANMPFNLSYVPYYALPYTEAAALTTNPASGFGTSLVTDLYVVDSRNCLYEATRGDANIDQMDDWFKDATVMKGRKYLGVAVKDGGKGMTVARNVRVVENYAPLFTIRTTTS